MLLVVIVLACMIIKVPEANGNEQVSTSTSTCVPTLPSVWDQSSTTDTTETSSTTTSSTNGSTPSATTEWSEKTSFGGISLKSLYNASLSASPAAHSLVFNSVQNNATKHVNFTSYLKFEMPWISAFPQIVSKIESTTISDSIVESLGYLPALDKFYDPVNSVTDNSRTILQRPIPFHQFSSPIPVLAPSVPVSSASIPAPEVSPDSFISLGPPVFDSYFLQSTPPQPVNDIAFMTLHAEPVLIGSPQPVLSPEFVVSSPEFSFTPFQPITSYPSNFLTASQEQMFYVPSSNLLPAEVIFGPRFTQSTTSYHFMSILPRPPESVLKHPNLKPDRPFPGFSPPPTIYGASQSSVIHSPSLLKYSHSSSHSPTSHYSPLSPQNNVTNKSYTESSSQTSFTHKPSGKTNSQHVPSVADKAAPQQQGIQNYQQPENVPKPKSPVPHSSSFPLQQGIYSDKLPETPLPQPRTPFQQGGHTYKHTNYLLKTQPSIQNEFSLPSHTKTSTQMQPSVSLTEPPGDFSNNSQPLTVHTTGLPKPQNSKEFQQHFQHQDLKNTTLTPQFVSLSHNFSPFPAQGNVIDKVEPTQRGTHPVHQAWKNAVSFAPKVESTLSRTFPSGQVSYDAQESRFSQPSMQDATFQKNTASHEGADLLQKNVFCFNDLNCKHSYHKTIPYRVTDQDNVRKPQKVAHWYDLTPDEQQQLQSVCAERCKKLHTNSSNTQMHNRTWNSGHKKPSLSISASVVKPRRPSSPNKLINSNACLNQVPSVHYPINYHQVEENQPRHSNDRVVSQKILSRKRPHQPGWKQRGELRVLHPVHFYNTHRTHHPSKHQHRPEQQHISASPGVHKFPHQQSYIKHDNHGSKTTLHKKHFPLLLANHWTSKMSVIPEKNVLPAGTHVIHQASHRKHNYHSSPVVNYSNYPRKSSQKIPKFLKTVSNKQATYRKPAGQLSQLVGRKNSSYRKNMAALSRNSHHHFQSSKKYGAPRKETLQATFNFVSYPREHEINATILSATIPIFADSLTDIRIISCTQNPDTDDSQENISQSYQSTLDVHNDQILKNSDSKHSQENADKDLSYQNNPGDNHTENSGSVDEIQQSEMSDSIESQENTEQLAYPNDTDDYDYQSSEKPFSRLTKITHSPVFYTSDSEDNTEQHVTYKNDPDGSHSLDFLDEIHQYHYFDSNDSQDNTNLDTEGTEFLDYLDEVHQNGNQGSKNSESAQEILQFQSADSDEYQENTEQQETNKSDSTDSQGSENFDSGMQTNQSDSTNSQGSENFDSGMQPSQQHIPMFNNSRKDINQKATQKNTIDDYQSKGKYDSLEKQTIRTNFSFKNYSQEHNTDEVSEDLPEFPQVTSSEGNNYGLYVTLESHTSVSHSSENYSSQLESENYDSPEDYDSSTKRKLTTLYDNMYSQEHGMEEEQPNYTPPETDISQSFILNSNNSHKKFPPNNESDDYHSPELYDMPEGPVGKEPKIILFYSQPPRHGLNFSQKPLTDMPQHKKEQPNYTPPETDISQSFILYSNNSHKKFPPNNESDDYHSPELYDMPEAPEGKEPKIILFYSQPPRHGLNFSQKPLTDMPQRNHDSYPHTPYSISSRFHEPLHHHMDLPKNHLLGNQQTEDHFHFSHDALNKTNDTFPTERIAWDETGPLSNKVTNLDKSFTRLVTYNYDPMEALPTRIESDLNFSQPLKPLYKGLIDPFSKHSKSFPSWQAINLHLKPQKWMHYFKGRLLPTSPTVSTFTNPIFEELQSETDFIHSSQPVTDSTEDETHYDNETSNAKSLESPMSKGKEGHEESKNNGGNHLTIHISHEYHFTPIFHTLSIDGIKEESPSTYVAPSNLAALHHRQQLIHPVHTVPTYSPDYEPEPDEEDYFYDTEAEVTTSKPKKTSTSTIRTTSPKNYFTPEAIATRSQTHDLDLKNLVSIVVKKSTSKFHDGMDYMDPVLQRFYETSTFKRRPPLFHRLESLPTYSYRGHRYRPHLHGRMPLTFHLHPNHHQPELHPFYKNRYTWK